MAEPPRNARIATRTRVISLTIAGAVSIETKPCRTVDFMITVPRGTHMDTAARRPSDDPVASTTYRQAATGNFFRHGFCRNSRRLDQPHFVFMPPEQMHLRALSLEHLSDEQPEFAVAQNGYSLAFGNLHLNPGFRKPPRWAR